MIYNVRYMICFLMFLFPANSITAQNIKNFEGIMVLDGIKGIASYGYYTSNKDTLKNGPFKLENPIQENQEKNELITSILNGHFKRNIPHGFWEMKRKTFLPTGNGYFTDYVYTFKINGSEFYLKGEFNEGKMNKQWEIFERKIEESSLTDTLLWVSMNFKNNVPTGKFRLQKNKKYLHAELDNKGFTQGKWVFNSIDEKTGNEITKEWIFEKIS